VGNNGGGLVVVEACECRGGDDDGAWSPRDAVCRGAFGLDDDVAPWGGGPHDAGGRGVLLAGQTQRGQRSNDPPDDHCG